MADLNAWISVKDALPEEGVVVHAKIDDEKGLRNEQDLKLWRRLWWFPDGSMYVYYTPTHWRSVLGIETRERKEEKP